MKWGWRSLLSKPNPEKDLEKLTQNLKSALGSRLKSLVVFGSMAGGGFDPRRSNVNVLVIAELPFEALAPLGTALQPWLKKGHVPPVLVTPDDLDNFARDFPIEFLDMQDAHRVLSGQDLLSGLQVDMKHLESQCEHDLALAQLRLRQAIAASQGKDRVIRRTLIESLPSVLTLFRTALRLEEKTAKLDKMKAAERLADRLGLDVHPFHQLKELKLHRKSDPLEELAVRYLDLIASVLAHLRKR